MTKKVARKKRRKVVYRKGKKNNFRTFYIICFLAIVLIFALLFYNNSIDDSSVKPEIANPASVNCVKKGGKVEIKENVDGSQYGMCKFRDGRECEEWTLFTDNKCKSKY